MDVKRAADLYTQGRTLRQIGAELGVHWSTVSQKLQELSSQAGPAGNGRVGKLNFHPPASGTSMSDEISLDDCLLIHAESLMMGFAGLSGMFEPMSRACESLRAYGVSGPQPPGQEFLLRVAQDALRAVVVALEQGAGPCKAALEGAPDDPQRPIAVTRSMEVLFDLVGQLSLRIELPISQWLTEMAVADVPPGVWPALWRVSVWLGAMQYYAGDAAVVLQALMQFLAVGSISERRRTGGQWLNEHGALAALERYREAPRHMRPALEASVARACAGAVVALADASDARAELALAAADATTASIFLDAKDVISLGLHSQIANPGGVFLSHRGKDAKRPLMNFYRSARPEIFLDIWARPEGETNRRFLWRNLGAASAMHAFVTKNYAASRFCMKEVEAWGLLSLARGRSAAETVGRFFVIDAASVPPSGVLCSWTRHRWEETTLERAMVSGAASLRQSGVLAARALYSDEEKEAYSAYISAVLGWDQSNSSARPLGEVVIEVFPNEIGALMNLLRHGLVLMRREGEVPGDVVDAIEAALPKELPTNGATFVTTLRDYVYRVLTAVKSYPMRDPVIRCALMAIAAMAETSAHIVRHWERGNPDDVWRSTVGFGQFRAVIESVGEQFGSWCVALELAGFAAEGVDELLAGLVLGLLPIDPEAAADPLRVDAGFVVEAQPTLPLALEAAGFARPTVHVVCTSAPTRWQRVTVIAALSSFTSRSFLFIHVEGSGALSARVGRLAMEEFPHVTVARIEDLAGS